jgi:hypothetical protein
MVSVLRRNPQTHPWQVSWLKDGTFVPNRFPSPASSLSGLASGYSLFTVAGPRRHCTGLPFLSLYGTLG